MAGLRKLPREAVSGTLGILMEATGVDASTLLDSLLRSVPSELKEEDVESKLHSSAEINVEKSTIYMVAVLHLVTSSDALERVVWTVCIPLLRNKNPKLAPLQTDVIEMLVKAVKELWAWSYMETILARSCLHALDSALSNGGADRSSFVSVSCQLVAALLTSAMEPLLKGKALTMESNKTTTSSAGNFCKEIVSLFIEPAMALLSQPMNSFLRHQAMFILLPPILKAIRFNVISNSSEEIETGEARISASPRIWDCCKKLFMHGALQRRDAYIALAVFAELLLPPVHFTNEVLLLQRTPQKFGFDKFDVRDDPLFWAELKAGLVDDEPLSRKRALCVLKRALPNPSGLLDSTTTTDCQHLPQNIEQEGDSAKGEELSQRNSRRERWNAFLLLYETLEEYKTHLVETAWGHQISLLLPFSKPKTGELRAWANPGIRSSTEGVDIDFKWISVLFQRGFDHKSPQVRVTVLRSFLELEWACAPKVKAFVPENFVLGPFLCALNDPVHHPDFGRKGIYSSETATMAAIFFQSYSASLYASNRAGFVQRLAKALVALLPSRAGLMALTAGLEAAAVGPFAIKSESLTNIPNNSNSSTQIPREDGPSDSGKHSPKVNGSGAKVLEDLQLVLGASNRHYNFKYRGKVCSYVLSTATALTGVMLVPIHKLAHFISAFPRKLLVQGGLLHSSLVGWLHPSQSFGGVAVASTFNSNKWLREGLKSMLDDYLRWNKSTSNVSITQEEFGAWGLEAQQWTRLLAVGVLNGNTQRNLVLLVQRAAAEIYQRAYMVPCVAEKVLLLLHYLMKECPSRHIDNTWIEVEDLSTSRLARCVADSLLNIMDELAQYAKISAGVFWDCHWSSPKAPPGAATETLEAPDKRQHPTAIDSGVLQGVLALTTLAESCMWYCQERCAADIPQFVVNFLWFFAWKVVTTPAAKDETGAKLQLTAYQVLASVCGALAATVSPSVVATAATQFGNKDSLFHPTCATLLDELVTALRSNVADVLQRGILPKTRYQVLIYHKWGCLDYLLSIPKSAVTRSDPKEVADQTGSSICKPLLENILEDAIDSLESAGEEYLLPLLRSIGWLMHWGVMQPVDPSDEAQERRVQIMWSLVQSGWATMADCKKREVATTTAFLSAVLHPTVFGDKEMHEAGLHDDDGPLKWLICRLIEKGARSSRTMRLTALHVTGLWLQFPSTLTCYVEQLKLLSLHGGELVHEDLNGYLLESQEDSFNYVTLNRSCDSEITEAVLNAEMYVRVTIGVMLHQLAQVVEDAQQSHDVQKLAAAKPACDCGRKLLLEMLSAVVEDTEPSKEYYKNHYPIYGQKLQAWQLLCILSRFVSSDEVDQVASLLAVSLNRDNLPSARHYNEIFAIQLFLGFPYLVEKNLISALRDYNMKPQALSSYVLIATNVVLCTPSAGLQENLLRQVLPAILPCLIAHHESIGTFTQVLIYQILQQWLTTNASTPSSSSSSPGSLSSMSSGQSRFSLERTCLQSLAAYLEGNADCMRIKSFMEKHLERFDPLFSTTPRGIFCGHGEVGPNKTVDDLSFQSTPVAVLDEISRFLNAARQGLREPPRADYFAVGTKLFSESQSETSVKEIYSSTDSYLLDLDVEFATSIEMNRLFQTSKGEYSRFALPPFSSEAIEKVRQHDSPMIPEEKLKGSSTKGGEISHIETTTLSFGADEELMLRTLEARARGVNRTRGTRQELIVVATLLGHELDLAALTGTCEVFEVATLVVADAAITENKESQLNSASAEGWVPYLEVSETGLQSYLQRKKIEGFSLLGLEQTANSVNVGNHSFAQNSVLVLGGDEGIPLEIMHMLDAFLHVPQHGVARCVNPFVATAIAVWEYTRQHRLLTRYMKSKVNP